MLLKYTSTSYAYGKVVKIVTWVAGIAKSTETGY